MVRTYIPWPPLLTLTSCVPHIDTTSSCQQQISVVMTTDALNAMFINLPLAAQRERARDHRGSKVEGCTLNDSSRR